MTMTPERLAELDAVMAKATVDAPWLTTGPKRSNTWGIHGEPFDVLNKRAVAYLGDVFGGENAAAIVALHNAYADLKAHIEWQSAEIERLRKLLE